MSTSITKKLALCGWYLGSALVWSQLFSKGPFIFHNFSSISTLLSQWIFVSFYFFHSCCYRVQLFNINTASSMDLCVSFFVSLLLQSSTLDKHCLLSFSSIFLRIFLFDLHCVYFSSLVIIFCHCCFYSLDVETVCLFLCCYKFMLKLQTFSTICGLNSFW
jgi:hypothetical protein